MTDSKMIQDIFKNLGRENASKLQAESEKMTQMELINRELDVPNYDPQKDYSSWPVGAPVGYNEQVWILLQPHNAADYEGNPETLRALWGLCHTKDPNKAKPFVPPEGTSGMYMTDECIIENGIIYRCTQDNAIYPPSELESLWDVVTL